GTSDANKIDINIGKDNFVINSAPPPDAFLRVLGVSVDIRISDGTTRIGHRTDQPGQVIEFAGKVNAVDLDHSAFLLDGGLGIQITDKTVIEGDDDLNTLAEVSAAMRAGYEVGAKGAGSVLSNSPRILQATKVQFEKRKLVVEFREFVKS